MTDPVPPSRFRSRLILLLIAGFFFGSFGLAASLFFGGWQPGKTRNYGVLLEPYPDLRGLDLRLADGHRYDWRPEQRRWHILAVAPANCGAPCASLLDALHRVWYSEGRHAERLQLLWFGELPASAPSFSGLQAMRVAPELSALLPEVAHRGGLPVYLVDPNGYVVLHYRAGFNPSELRKDLGRLIK